MTELTEYLHTAAAAEYLDVATIRKWAERNPDASQSSQLLPMVQNERSRQVSEDG